jgi:hypothetical protein
MPKPAATAPTIKENGDETHPAFALIGVSRINASPGVSLFDSDVLHQHFVRVKLSRAVRKRSLQKDRMHAEKQIIEVDMSEAQWASFVSSMNVGDGVPCTISWESGVGLLPELEFAPRLAVSMAETREAAQRAFEDIQKAMAALDALDPKAPAKDRKAALMTLRARIENAPKNVAFASESLVEHTENVVNKARADIEAMVQAKATQLGIASDDITLSLTAGEDKE